MLLGTAKQKISHETGVQGRFGIGLVGALVLSALSGHLPCRLQVSHSPITTTTENPISSSVIYTYTRGGEEQKRREQLGKYHSGS